MTTITVRGLDASVTQRLAEQAKRNGRSVEAEVRDILTQATLHPHVGLALVHAAQDLGGVDELQIPPRSETTRAVNLE